MKKDRVIRKQAKVIDQQAKKIDQMESTIKVLAKKVANTSRTELSKEIESTKNVVKKNQKFNVKVWLLTSSFAIASCIFGLVNLILNILRWVK